MLPMILLLSVVMLCIVTWRFYPSFRCAVIAAGFFIVAMPFVVPSLDQTPRGHPDLRGVFLLFGMPLLIAGAIVAGVGMCSRSQQRLACAAVLLIALGALLFGLTLGPTSLPGY